MIQSPACAPRVRNAAAAPSYKNRIRMSPSIASNQLDSKTQLRVSSFQIIALPRRTQQSDSRRTRHCKTWR